MSTFFVDTSALAKRYISEIGTQWVLSWMLPQHGHVIVISALSTVEMFSLFSRRQREGSLTTRQASTLGLQFLYHVSNEYLAVNIDADVLSLSQQLLTQYPLRTLDAIQLASAQHTSQVLHEPMTFITGDQRLLQIARQVGFKTDDPNLHP